MAFFFQQNDPAAILVALVIGGIMIAIVAAVWYESTKKQRELDAARDAYHASLADLRNEPTNPTLRHTTLELGRAYSSLTRENKGVTLFDEVALSNDIGAACAAASAPIIMPMAATPPAPASIQDRLRQLESLRSQALISDEEYTSRRERILDEV
jgi:hypothetical protein